MSDLPSLEYSQLTLDHIASILPGFDSSDGSANRYSWKQALAFRAVHPQRKPEIAFSGVRDCHLNRETPDGKVLLENFSVSDPLAVRLYSAVDIPSRCILKENAKLDLG